MSTDVITPIDNVPGTSEQVEPMAKMDTSVGQIETEPASATAEQTSANGTTENKGEKRKRPTKKTVEIDETSVSNARPRRTLSKREDPPLASTVNGNGRKAKATRASVEHSADDDDDRDKNLPIVHDVADVVWVKMGGHPWWPSIIVRDPNDNMSCFTKITGNARAKRIYFVSFYGSTADFAWVPDSTIIPYKGVDAFTKYAQEAVDNATTKGQKEQLTERFQLKITMSRREDWETAVKEADLACNQTSEKRLEDIEPKIEFYTSKTASSGRKSKVKIEQPVESPVPSTDDDDDDNDDDDDDDDVDAMPVRKAPLVKIKFNQQTSNDNNTQPAKRRYVRKSTGTSESGTTIFGQTANGSSVSYDTSNGDGTDSSPKKRGRPRISKPSVITSNNAESNTTLKKPIKKPQAFANTKVESVPTTNVLNGQHHRFETRVGFLSPYEEQEIFELIDQLRTNKTFDEVEQLAKQRFEQILCANLNKTQVDIPHEWFYSFLFAHPNLIIKNTHWFNEKTSSDLFNNADILNDINRTQSTSSTQVLKHQLRILSKLYANQLQVRSTNV